MEKEIIPKDALNVDSEVRYGTTRYSHLKQAIESLDIYKSRQKTRSGKIIDRILTKEASVGSDKISKIKIETK
ncbi:MAG: hypothetical protein ACOCSL_00940 [Thermoplasmatota archaeon]